MRFVSDSPAVAHIEKTWSEFARDPRQLRLDLASDGVSSYSIRSSTYSVWPVALMNYNIPPWLATKKCFILLALIVPGPKQTKNVDVFLQPLVMNSTNCGKVLMMSPTIVHIGLVVTVGLLKGLIRWSILHELPYWKIDEMGLLQGDKCLRGPSDGHLCR
ncbi:hypothetical protein R1sor_013464 [Riccia sorocarpa]|uniref:Uncharacterized protein n=1 Tax=Riccia sorocarpa TaxID=122646 RepID=A0ABD3HA71_9MARC